jgi:hypothetical protein
VAVSRPGGPASWREQVRTGLVNLGWQARDADHAIAAVEADLAALSATNGAAADGTGADGTGADGTGADGTGADGAAAAQQPDAAVMLRAALRKLSRA